jgi:hypothetical protein
MSDVVVLVIIVVFFALSVAYVRWCDHIIGPDPDGLRDTDGDEHEHEHEHAEAVAPLDVTVVP